MPREPSFCHHPERGQLGEDVFCMARNPAPDAPLGLCHLKDGHETKNHHQQAKSGPCFTWEDPA